MSATALPVGGSFRDPSSRVYEIDGRILRGLDQQSVENFRALETMEFYKSAVANQLIIETHTATGPDAATVMAQGWAGVLEHKKLALISYPYEWTFSMLKDAALLHLDLLEQSLNNGWVIKDSSSYNIQFVGSTPVFIDIPSFVPRAQGSHWAGYRQFCMLFLYPLMLKSHLDIDFGGILRSSLDGLSPRDAAHYFSGLKKFKRGVLSHIIFPATVERRTEQKQWAEDQGKRQSTIKHSDSMVLGLVHSLRRLVESLKAPVRKTAWSEYTDTHSYDREALDEKSQFVATAVESSRWDIAWDIGCNTGTFSRICATRANKVVALDSSHDAVELLYLAERQRMGTSILPIHMDLANISPNQGWAGMERIAFDKRNNPDLVICLALIHHMSLAANIPIALFLDWLRSLGAKLVIEFVTREDMMVQNMLARKQEEFPAYNSAVFDQELGKRFRVLRSKDLKSGTRKIYFCEPLAEEH